MNTVRPPKRALPVALVAARIVGTKPVHLSVCRSDTQLAISSGRSPTQGFASRHVHGHCLEPFPDGVLYVRVHKQKVVVLMCSNLQSSRAVNERPTQPQAEKQPCKQRPSLS